MIARLFPLRITFPVPLTAPWRGFADDMLKLHFLPKMREQLMTQPILLSTLRTRNWL